MKSTPEQIRARFDQDVQRFANLETGQSATMDAPLVLELIAETVAVLHPQARSLLDVGCGAGNFTLKVLQRLPNLGVTLIDLSRPMLDRACQRVETVTRGPVVPIQGDIREVPLGEGQYDFILAAAVLHHLRTESEWQTVFAKFYAALKPSGSVWISDLIAHELPKVQDLIWRRYGEYLTGLKGQAYRDQVFAYIEAEDTPRPLLFQTDLLRKVGFSRVEMLHKNNCFAAFGGLKP
jgi:tRNA (cmo5U34)-methyltransferase